MSNQKGSDSADTNTSESESNSGNSSNTDQKDSQSLPHNSEISQSDRQDNVNEENSPSSNFTAEETSVLVIQEMSSEESLQGNISDVVGGVRIIYEFPDDSENSEISQPIRQSQKRQRDGKNEHFAKKLKNDMSGKCQNDSAQHDYSVTESNSSNSREIRNSSESIDNSRRTANHFRRLSKEKVNKKPTRIETHDKTNEFKKVVVISSTSIGALADIEDNADSQSNDDISDDHEENCQDSIFNDTNTVSTEIVVDREGTSSQSVDMVKESDPKKQTKADNIAPGVVSEFSTSQPAGGKGGETSATNQLKKKSDVGRLKKRKCFVCNKKLGLTAFTCRCGGLYCSQHRYDKEHNCNFDYKSMGAEEIRKNNPVIVAEKISKL